MSLCEAALSPKSEVEVLVDRPDHQKGFAATLAQVARLSLPVSGINLLWQCLDTIGLVFLSHVAGAEEIAGMGMGNLVYNCLALCLGSGLSSGLDTLVSQAYGQEDHARCRLYLQRCEVCMVVLFAMAGTLLVFTKAFLLGLGATDEQTASHAGTYTRYAIIGLLPCLMFTTVSKFLFAQKISSPSFNVQFVSVPMHLFWCWLLVPRYRIAGVAVAVSIKNWTDLLLLSAYLWAKQPTPGCVGWWKCWQAGPNFWIGLMEYLQMAMPGVIMMTAEWWALEWMGLLAGWLGSSAVLAGHVALANITNLLYMWLMGVPMIVASIVGSAVSRGSASELCLGVRAGLFWNVFMASILAAALVLSRGAVAEVYVASSEDAKQQVVRLCPLLAFIGLCDAAILCLQGALRGMALQKLSSRVTLFSYWPIMIAGGYVMAFPLDFGLTGVWAGCAAGRLVSVMLNALLYGRADFSAVVSAAQKRLVQEPLVQEPTDASFAQGKMA